jgi:hypothetical protein
VTEIDQIGDEVLAGVGDRLSMLESQLVCARGPERDEIFEISRRAIACAGIWPWRSKEPCTEQFGSGG